MSLMGLKRIITMGVVVIMVIPFFVSAQNTNPTTPTTSNQNTVSNYSTSINADDIDLIMTPEFPGAFNTVSIRLNSDTIDLNRYLTEWFEDGELIQKDVGLRTYSFSTKGYGSTTKINVIIHVGAATIQKDIYIAPEDATLLWEAIDSSTPPFYRGKKLPGREALIRISGIPNFRPNSSIKINDAVYLWTRNGNKILNVGGYAKDSIVIEQNRLRTTEQITANISDVAGNKTQKTVVLPTIDPEFHWYTRNNYGYRPLRAVDQGLRILKGDITLVAEPYFFSTKNGTNDLSMIWKNGSDTISLDPDSPKQELLVHNPGQTGRVDFEISATNPKTFLQSALRPISLYFQSQ